MGNRDLLRSIESHLAESTEQLRLNREEFQLNREEAQRSRDFYAKAQVDMRKFFEESREDWKEFTRTILLRVERMGRDEMRELSRMNDQLERQGAEQRAEQRGLREESRAQTQALLRVTDRMDRLDPPGAAA